MTLNGQAGGSSANLAHSAEKRDLPIGPNIGTLAVLLATILTDGGEWLRVVSKAEACLHDFFSTYWHPRVSSWIFIKSWKPLNCGSGVTEKTTLMSLGAR